MSFQSERVCVCVAGEQGRTGKESHSLQPQKGPHIWPWQQRHCALK